MILIDADAILKRAEESFKNAGLHGEDYRKFKKWLQKAPTIDAVEVVRCKECRYFKKIVERSDSGLCYRDLVASAWKENGYCSRGERGEESEVEE